MHENLPSPAKRRRDRCCEHRCVRRVADASLGFESSADVGEVGGAEAGGVGLERVRVPAEDVDVARCGRVGELGDE